MSFSHTGGVGGRVLSIYRGFMFHFDVYPSGNKRHDSSYA